LEYHLVKCVALETLGRLATATIGPGSVSPDKNKVVNVAWRSATQLLRTSVFKSVRNAATRTLELSGYQYLQFYNCFGDNAMQTYGNEGFTTEVIGDVLAQTLSPTMHQKLSEKTKKMRRPATEIDNMYTQRTNLAVDPVNDPTVLLYFHLASKSFTLDRHPELFIQDRLNSSDRLERFVGLLCIGRFQDTKGCGSLKDEVVPTIATCELVSTVRDLAVKVMGIGAGGGWCAPPEKQIDRRNKMVERELKRLKEKSTRPVRV